MGAATTVHRLWTAGTYAGWDRFGRTVDQKWQEGTPTVVDRFEHGYDYAGNRLWRDVGRQMTNPTVTGKDEASTPTTASRA